MNDNGRIPHGAMRVEERPDGSIVAYFWNEHLQTWTYEDPADGDGGCTFTFWLGLILIITLGLTSYAYWPR